MNEREIVKVADEVKTPAFVFSEEDFRRRAEETRRVLGPEIGLCYSIKANPVLLKILPDVFSNVEVCSPGELEICIAEGISPDMIIYSGLNKGREDISRAIEYGAGEITAESSLHLEMINSCAGKAGKKVRVLIRIAAESQFGIDRKEAMEIIRGRDSYDNLDFYGLHFFTGTQKRKPREIIKELDFLSRYMEVLREEADYIPTKIEYGTGCPAYLFGEKEIDSAEKAEEAEMEFLGEIADAIGEMAGRVKLTIEMGRFFAAPCGYYFTEVVDSKTNDGTNYAIIDGGSHQIRYFGQMQGMQLPFISHVPKDHAGDGNKTEAWTIAGSLCTTADILARNASFDNLKTGDVLVFGKAGAYAVYEGMSLFLSRDLPRIYLYKDSKLTLIRDRVDTYKLTGAL